MAIAYYGDAISPHMDRTPEGYLICRDVPINRTGEQLYTAGELGLPGDGERPVTVYRLAEDVFAPEAMASLEGKDVTRGHPPEMLSAENQAGYSKGHLENVRRVGDNTVADLIIKDAALASDVENGLLREVSCGYNCTFVPYLDGYRQTNIVGNHLAVVPRGRAGRDVAIKDAAEEAEKGRNHMSEFWKSFLTAFGMAAKDATPEELGQMAQTTAAVLDAQPEEKPQEEKPVEDEDIPKGDDLGSKLDRILEMLEAKSRGGRGEHDLHDETDLDEAMARLAGGEEKAEDACMAGPARDAYAQLLKRVRPAVSSIQDKQERARVVDALLAPMKQEGQMEAIAKAAMDSAMDNAKKTQRASYEQICADSEAAYAARNPHNKKEV